MKLGLFYGTTTGFTETAAETVRGLLGDSLSVYKNISESSPEDLATCDNLILAIPTWDVGQLQSDWWAFFPKLDSIDFHGKKVAFIGIGDQYGYPDTFLDAMGDLYLVGKPLLAAYSAFRSGHALNNLLLRELEAHPEAWEIVTFDNERLAPTGFAQPARAW